MAEQSWTDDPITAGSNRIRKKSIHFTELQDAINAWETAYSIPNTSFTDSPTTGIKITSSTIVELQNTLDSLAYVVYGGAPASWTEASTTKTIKPAHINELRDSINNFQNNYCYLCDACDTYIDCNLCDTACYNDACDLCDTSCYGYSACSCNYTVYGCTCYSRCYVYLKFCSCCYNTTYGCTCYSACYGYSGCSCNSTCYNDACDLCDNQCYEDTCSQCHVTNYRYPWS